MAAELNQLKPLPPIKSAAEVKQILENEHMLPPDGGDEILNALESINGSITNTLLTRIFSLTQPPTLPQQEVDEVLPADVLTVDALRRLELGFIEHEEYQDNGKGIGVEEFVMLWHNNVYPYQSAEELHQLFVKIDAHCTGLLTWKGFISYIWVEMNKMDLMKVVDDRAPYPNNLGVTYAQKERDAIASIQLMQVNLLEQPVADQRWGSVWTNTGRYISLCRNGMLRVFNLSCNIIESFNLRDYHRRSQIELTATDMVFMSNTRMIAVCFAHSHNIHFYTITTKAVSGYKLFLTYNIRRLYAAPMCMEYIVNPNNMDHSHLIWGDTRGCVNILSFNAAATKGPFGLRISNQPSMQCDLKKIQQGKYPTAKLSIKKAHDDWVLKIKRCSLLFDYGFVSCSKGSKVSVYYGDLNGSRTCGSVSIKRGVTCVEFTEQISSIYAGCVDGKIRVIKPSPRRGIISQIFHGHSRPVTALAVDARRQLLISAGEDHRLVVYKIGQATQMQSVDISIGSLSGIYQVSALFVNPFNSSLLIGTYCLGMLEYRETMDHLGKAMLSTHDGSCNHALYNPLFGIVVSCDAKSTLCIWKLKTGQKLIQFRDCHQRKVKGNMINQEIVMMSFDPSFRRLLTGAHDGTAHIWNVNNGMLLRRMDPRIDGKHDGNKKSKTTGADDALGLLWSEENNRIAIVLSNSRAVYTYIDEPRNEECYALPVIHTSDVNCMARLPPTLIATCSSNGDIIVRSLTNGKPSLMFNAAVSTTCILDQRLDNYKTKLKAGRIQAQSAINTTLKEGLANNTMFRKYSSLQKQSEGKTDCKAGDESRIYLYDCPRYKHMALAASIGYNESALKDQQSMNELFSDTKVAYSKFKTSLDNLNQKGNATVCGIAAPELSMSNSVDCVLVLLNRMNTRYTATLITGGADGWVRAWSTVFKGELLGQFNAAHHNQESIVSMATDIKNEFLFTGDSEGYIKVWDIEIYCLDEQQTQEITKPDDYLIQKVKKYAQFVLLANDMSKLTRRISRRLRLRSLLAMRDLPPPKSEPLRTLKAATLLSSFRGHMQGITSLAYIDNQTLVVSSSADGNVRLWTLHGLYIGHFGQSIPWNIDAVFSPTNQTRLLPHDVKKVASSTTLTVWNGGNFKRWSRLRAICMAAGLTSFLSSHFKKKASKLSVVDKEKDKENTSTFTRKSWAGVASAIQMSVTDYIARNRTSALKRLDENDENIDWIAEGLNPNPADKEFTAAIKTIWWKSLKFQILKLGDTPGQPTPEGSRPALASSFQRESQMDLTMELSAPNSSTNVYNSNMANAQSEILETVIDKLHDNPAMVSGFDAAPQNVGSKPAQVNASDERLPDSISQLQAWRRLSVPSNEQHVVDEPIEGSTQETTQDHEPRRLSARVKVSKYLGKSYKKHGRHRPLPKIKPPKMYDSTYAVYSALPFVGMDTFRTPSPPEGFYKLMAARQPQPFVVQDELKLKHKGKRKITSASQGTKASSVTAVGDIERSSDEKPALGSTTPILV